MQLTKFIPALLGAILCASAIAADEPIDYRLPPEIRPIAQSIELRLDPSTPDYSGSTVLQIDVDSDRYEKYVDSYLASTNAPQKINILRALYFKNPAIVKKALDFSISDAVMASDASYALTYYPTVLNDHTILYDWLEANLSAFETKIPSREHQRLPTTMTGICNDRNLALMREFFNDRDEKYATSFDTQVENVSTCIARRERDSAALMEFLSKYDE